MTEEGKSPASIYSMSSARLQHRLHMVWAIAFTQRGAASQAFLFACVRVWESVHPWVYTTSAEYRSPGSPVKAGLSVAQMHELHSLQSHRTHSVPQLSQEREWGSSCKHVKVFQFTCCAIWHLWLQVFFSCYISQDECSRFIFSFLGK